MPATNQLPKIADLVQQLDPLGAKQRGMPIEPDDWNAIVAVLRGVLEVERAQEDGTKSALDLQFAPKDHEHLGQATVAWLDPSLQATVTSGPAVVTAQVALANLQQQVTALNAQLAQLTQKLDQQQKILDQFSVNDVDRSRTLTGFEARFAGVENLRTLVTGVGQQVDGLTASVNTVLDLRKSLSDATGAPIDVAKIRQDVTALQVLSANFNGIDGTPVRLRDLQLQLKDVQDAAGVGGTGGLEGRLGALSADLEGKLTKKIDDQGTALHDQLAAEQTTQVTQVKTDLQASVATASQQLRSELTQAIGDAQTKMTTAINGVLTQIRGEMATAVKAAADDVFQRASSLVSALRDEVNRNLKQQIDQVRSDTTTQIQKSLSQTTSVHEVISAGGGPAHPVVTPVRDNG